MTSFYPEGTFSPKNFAGSTVIIPSISLANLPQLCVDLIITSLGLNRVGYIGDGTTAAPFCGLGESGEVLTGGLEVYGSSENKLFAIQQRSPVLKTKKDEHTDLIQLFVHDHGFSFALIVTSLDAANQNDTQLLTPHQRIIPPSSTSTDMPQLRQLAELPPLSLQIDSDRLQTSSAQLYPPFLPAAGLTRRLLSSLQDTSVPHGCLSAWCVEGDNRGDAHSLAAQVLKIVGHGSVELIEPSTWQSLFGVTNGWSGGAGVDAELYG